MTVMTRICIGVGLVIALIALIVISMPRPLAVAPEAVVTTIKGEPIDLKALRGKPVIVTFWATDCRACIEEIPHLLDLYEDYHARGLEVIAISMYYDPPSHVVAMSEAKRLPYSVVLDVKAELALAFGQVGLTPTTFLIAPDGSVPLQYLGAFDIQAIRSALDEFLKG